jgi:hypothetical protein
MPRGKTSRLPNGSFAANLLLKLYDSSSRPMLLRVEPSRLSSPSDRLHSIESKDIERPLLRLSPRECHSVVGPNLTFMVVRSLQIGPAVKRRLPAQRP